MRTLNVRLAAILLAVLVLFGAGVYLLHAYQVRHNAHVFKDAADRAIARAEKAAAEDNQQLAQKGYFDALQDLGWYVRFRPDDVDVLEEFAMRSADWADRAGDSRSYHRAFSRLEAVLRRDPKRDEVRRRLIELDMDRRAPRYRDAKEHLKAMVPDIDNLQALKPSPDRPELPELLSLYGQCQAGLNDYAGAEATFRKAISCGPGKGREHVEAYAMLADVLRNHLKRPDEADDWMDKMVKANPNSAKAHVFKGKYVYQRYVELQNTAARDRSRSEALEKLDEAFAEVLTALKLAPNDPDAVEVPLSDGVIWLAPDDGESLWLAAQCAIAKGQLDAARRYVTFGIEQNPGFSAMYLVLADIEMREGNPDKAVDALLDGIQATPQRIDFLDSLSRMLIENHARTEMGQPDIKQESVDRIGRSLKLTAARLERRLAEADGSAASSTAQPGVSLSLAATQRVVKALEAMGYPKPNLAFLNGQIAIAQGHWLTARQEFEQARSAFSDRPESLKQIDCSIGYCYGQAGEYDRQLQAYRRALSIDPFYPPARVGVIDALRAAGSVDEALEESRRFASGPGAAIPLAQMMIQRNRQKPSSEQNWEAVERLLAQAEKAMPDSPQIPLLRVQAFLQRKRPEDAAKVLEEACDKSAKRSQVLVDVTSWSVEQQGDWDTAEELLREADEENVARSDLLRGLALLAEDQGEWDKAEGLLTEAGKAGDRPGQRLAQAQYLVRRCEASVERLRREAAELPRQEAIEHLRKDAAKRLRELAENADAFSDAERVQLCSGLLNAAMQVDDAAQTEQLRQRITHLCQQIAEKEPDNAQIRYNLLQQSLAHAEAATLKARGKDVDSEPSLPAEDDAAIDQALAKIEGVAGKNEYWFYGQAVRLWLHPKDDNRAEQLSQALKCLSQAQELRPTWAQIPLLEAKIYDRQGETSRALEHYQEAIRLGARNVDAVQKTIDLLFQRQQYGDADRLLRQLEKEQLPFSAELNLDSAQTALAGSGSGQREFDRALEMARKAASQESKSYATHIRLGRLLAFLGGRKRTEAEQLRAEAEQLKSKGRVAQGETTLAKAEQTLTEANDVLRDAETALRRAVDIEPKAPETWATLVWFLSALQQQGKAEEKIAEVGASLPAPQAALVQAQCYSAMNRLSLAQEKYDAALAADPENPQTILLVGGFYARADKPEQAESLLRKIIDGEVRAKEAEMIPARRSLASILVARGGDANLQKARDLIEKNLATAKPAVEDRRLKALVDVRDSRPGRRAEAVRELEGLVQEQLAAPEDRFLLAQAYLAGGSWAHASDQLRYLVVNYRDDPRYATAYISALLQHGETSDAETHLARLEEMAPQDLSTVGLRIETLVARNEWEKALALLDQFGGRFSAFSLAQLYSRLLTHGTTDETHLRRFDDILQVALNRFDRPSPLLSALADLRIRQGRCDGDDGAEALYREILRKQDRDFVTMNNLAVLLALRGIKLDEALQLVNQAIEIAGPMAAMLDSRATVHMARGEPADALKDMAQALANAESPVWLFHQACAYEQAGQRDAAVAAMKKALQAGKGSLTAQMLHPLELPAFERLRQLAR